MLGLARGLDGFDPEPGARPEEVVRMAAAAVLDVGLRVVRYDSRLADLAPFDSLHLLEIVATLDHHFEIRIPTDTLSRKIAVSHLAALVTAERARRAEAS